MTTFYLFFILAAGLWLIRNRKREAKSWRTDALGLLCLAVSLRWLWLHVTNHMLHWNTPESDLNQLTVTIIGLAAGCGLLHARDHRNS